MKGIDSSVLCVQHILISSGTHSNNYQIPATLINHLSEIKTWEELLSRSVLDYPYLTQLGFLGLCVICFLFCIQIPNKEDEICSYYLNKLIYFYLIFYS